MTDTVQVEIDGPVRTVTMCRPEKGNAMNGEMLRAMEDAFDTATGPGPDERVAVIRGQGRMFCTGLDLSGGIGKDQNVETLFSRVETWPLPGVAVVQGAAIAGGNELALHSDFVVASDKARFGMSLAQIGLAPTWFLTKKLMEIAGPVMTREILLLGDPVPAARMHELGFIARCVAPEELEEATDAIVDRMVRNAPLSLRAMKGTIHRQLAFRNLVDHDDTDELVRAAMRSDDSKEGVRARMEKRPANFTGR